MKQRCLNPNHPKYYRYGGRGIKVWEEWKPLKNFYLWATQSGFREGLSIDRINNDGDYNPENCRWISISLNSKNKSTTKISDQECFYIRKDFSEGKSLNYIAKEYGVCSGTIWFIVNNITHKTK